MFSNFRINLPNTLATKLTLWYTGAFIVFLFLALLATYTAINTTFNSRMNDDLLEDIEEFQEIFEDDGLEKVLWEIQQEIKYEDPEHFFIRLMTKEGNPILTSDLNHWSELATADELFQQLSDQTEPPQLDIIHFEDHEHESRTAAGMIGSDIILQLGESMEEKDEIMAILFWVSAIIFCLIIPVASLIGWFMAKKAVKGIKEVSKAAMNIKNGALDSRVDIPSQGDEIDELANTFNAMAERIRKLITEMREMTDNIAHDLRSPLGRIRAISEVTLSGQASGEVCQKAASDTLEECDRLLQMINMTLDVAEAEANVSTYKNDRINLSKLTEDACELFEPLADEKQIQLTTELEEGCHIEGNKHNIQRMLTNLIDNALKYTPEQGKISVKLENQFPQTIITVADTGIGIPEEERPRIFDRFYRCDQSRSKEGCGLGLSFSRAVARAHGGDLTLEQAPQLSSIFKVRLNNQPVQPSII
ncbi:sensor histidine kinase [Litoribacillus peritrichatus]|uniref:histidine kinase n=1 Tax=Litoribacillus peritrichatus TaxID=718191 RepID=A0ABP7MSB6_9GAMM